MRPRLPLVIAAAALLALLSGTSRAGAGTAACIATATGKHVRTQLLKVHLAGTFRRPALPTARSPSVSGRASTPMACTRSTTQPGRCGCGCLGRSR